MGEETLRVKDENDLLRGSDYKRCPVVTGDTSVQMWMSICCGNNVTLLHVRAHTHTKRHTRREERRVADR